jgi:hypothetical protein
MQVFVSLLLVFGSVLLFLFSARQRDFDHADRLALLPVEEDTSASPSPGNIPAAAGASVITEGSKA